MYWRCGSTAAPLRVKELYPDEGEQLISDDAVYCGNVEAIISEDKKTVLCNEQIND